MIVIVNQEVRRGDKEDSYRRKAKIELNIIIGKNGSIEGGYDC